MATARQVNYKFEQCGSEIVVTELGLADCPALFINGIIKP